MARTRSVKPGFFKNEILAQLPFQDQLLFIGLWTLADREGRLEDRPLRIKAEVFPYREVDVEASLCRLHQCQFIARYDTGQDKYIQIPTFTKHQSPHRKEQPSTIPAPGKHEVRPYLGQSKDNPLKNNRDGHAMSQDSISPILAAPSTLPPSLPSTLTAEESMRPEFDDQFQEYRTLFEKASSKPTIPEDFTVSWHAWKILDFEQKKTVLDSLRQRIEHGAFLGHTPYSYLEKREWKRPVKPAGKPVAVARPYTDSHMTLEQQRERDERILREGRREA